MHEVERAIDRVDQPQVAPGCATTFLGEDGVAFKRALHGAAQETLHGVIGRGDEVLRSLALDGPVDVAAEVALRQGSCFARDAPREFRAAVDVGGVHTWPLARLR